MKKLGTKPVSIDELARERLSSKNQKAINNILLLVIQYNDEHVGIKADNSGIQINSKIRFRGLGMILLGIGGTLIAELMGLF